MKVLVVDDTPENVYMLEVLLKGHGYEVSTTVNGIEALEKLKHYAATLIISDILMPKMDGFQLCRAVKADDSLKNIPFIFYTATYTTEKDKDFALSLGASRFILKPADPDDFINIIKEVLAEKKTGLLDPGEMTIEKETEYLKEHQARLIKKLGDKIAELERSEERYRSLISCAADAIITLDESGMITSWNEAAEKIFRYDSDEVIGKHLSLLIPAERRAEQDAILMGLKGKKQTECLEAVGRSKTGDLIPVGISFSLMKDKHGAALGFSGIIRDMTERKQAERSLAEKEARLRILLETIPDLIWLKDADGVYLFCNKMFEQFFGAMEADIIGKTDYDFVNKELADFFREHDRRAMAAGKPSSNMEWITYASDGHRALLNTIKTPMYDADGKLLGVLGIGRDITEYHKLEEQLRHVQKIEALGTLAGGIAHDFNNILNIIVGYGSMMEARLSKDDPNTPYLREILAASERATHLTQALLIFSRKQITELKPVNINDLVSGMKKMVFRIIGEDIKTGINLAAEQLTVMGDYGQLEQVLMNFATNARDAMPDGGSLTIDTQPFEMDAEFIHYHGFGKPGRYALISASDTGQGMDEKTRDRIFEPFFTTKGVGKGTGLGLSIVYGIVQQHNGYINCYSEPGKGTMFRVYLPLVDNMSSVMEEKELPPLQGGSETILVADDNENVRKLTKEILEQYSYIVLEAKDGEDAVSKFRNNRDKIQLVLLDVIMPRKSGKEAFEEIRALQPDIKVLFISGYIEDNIQRKRIMEEKLPLLQKPVKPRELLSKIREMLDGKQG